MSVVLTAVAALAAIQAEASTPPFAIPDPATIKVPTVTGGRDPTVAASGWKHFYFWRASTSFAEAYRDVADCYRFLPVANAAGDVPSFAPFNARPNAAIVKPVIVNNSGLVGAVVGAVIGGMVAGPIERRLRQSRMRRCMEPRGYERFPATEATWEEIIDNYSPGSIAVQAKLASGPRPDADPLMVTR